MRRTLAWLVAAALLAVLTLGGCSTLAVRVPGGMFVSTSHYVPGVRTLGVVQARKTVVAPLLIMDLNKVRQQLYEELIQKARDAGATGLSDVKFSWLPSPWNFLSISVATAVIDVYIEGFAVVEK